MFDLDDKVNLENLIIIHVKAGLYEINVINARKKPDYDEMLDKAVKKLVEVSKKIPIDRQPVLPVNEVA